MKVKLAWDTKFALISTDYFGGVGSQFATVYRNGERVFEVTENGINQALSVIGVTRNKGKDEFDSLDLGEHRDFGVYFEKYWD